MPDPDYKDLAQTVRDVQAHYEALRVSGIGNDHELRALRREVERLSVAIHESYAGREGIGPLALTNRERLEMLRRQGSGPKPWYDRVLSFAENITGRRGSGLVLLVMLCVGLGVLAYGCRAELIEGVRLLRQPVQIDADVTVDPDTVRPDPVDP